MGSSPLSSRDIVSWRRKAREAPMSSSLNPPPPPLPKSTFVTTLAWIFIVLAGFATPISILQNIMFAVVFSSEQTEKAVNTSRAGDNVPPLIGFMFSHFRLYFFAFFLVSVTTLVAAIGLLKRQNWARLVFVGLMIFGMAWSVLSIAIQEIIFSSNTGPPSRRADPTFGTMMLLMRIFTALFALALAGLWGWIAKRLISPKVRAEFTAASG